jgi:serine/threonine protein phosphatase 1
MTEKYKRIIGIGDPHGCYDLLKDLIEDQVQFNPENDFLVVLGDMIDRGPNSKGVVLYLQDLRQMYPSAIVLLKGNHEDMAYHFLNQAENPNLKQSLHATMWFANGGDKTLSNFVSLDEAKELLIPFIGSLENYYETDTHLFAHGGIPHGKDLKTVTQEDLLWDRSLSYNGSKTLIVGHTPQVKVTRKGNVMCVDTEAYLTGMLSGFDVINNRVYQTISKHKFEIGGNYGRRKSL